MRLLLSFFLLVAAVSSLQTMVYRLQQAIAQENEKRLQHFLDDVMEKYFEKRSTPDLQRSLGKSIAGL